MDLSERIIAAFTRILMLSLIPASVIYTERVRQNHLRQYHLNPSACPTSVQSTPPYHQRIDTTNSEIRVYVPGGP